MLRKLLNFCLILISLSGIQTSFADAFRAANAPGAIGETGSLYLLDQGVFSRPFYNDVFGKTDKQLSGATQLGYLKIWSDSSLESKTHWRFITPSFKEEFNAKNLQLPVGRYADWMELQETWAKVFQIKGQTTRIQISAGLGEIGDHGAKQVHRKFHKFIGSSLLGLDYDQQPKGMDLSLGAEFGLIDGAHQFAGSQTESLLNFGFFNNKFMHDVYLNHNHVFKVNEDFRWGFESRLVKQISSEAYLAEILPWRFEFAASLRYKWYRPSIKYVSPYLKGDEIGQLYFDPLAFFIAW